MRITFTLPTLLVGGAERTVSNMANYWAARGWEITILTLSHGARAPGFALRSTVTHRDIAYYEQIDHQAPSPELENSLQQLFDGSSDMERAVIEGERERLEHLRRELIGTRPRAVISFECATNIRALLAAGDLDVPIIVSERSDPRYLMLKNEGWVGLQRRLYSQAEWLVTLTEETQQHFAALIGNRCRIIPNFVLPPAVDKGSGSSANKSSKIVAAMGRLAAVKGFDLLLRAFAEVAPKHRQWSLEIWGEGALLPDLEQLARELGIAHSVRFKGFTKRTHEALQRADLFVLSSHYEGFPNALCEAMACGVAVISVDCPSGPRHIIRHGVDGILVPPENVAALAESLDRLMGDETLRGRLGQRATDVVERYNPEKIMAMWEDLILNSTGNVGSHRRVLSEVQPAIV